MQFLLWAAYYDNHPHGTDYGTIKQQWWSLSHFLLHLGYVGIVEGSNRMAVFYYSATTVFKISDTIDKLCEQPGTTNEIFIKTMNDTLTALKIEYYDPRKYDIVQGSFYEILADNELSSQDCYDNVSFSMR